MTTEKDVKIHVKGLKKSFGHVHVLKGIDAEIKAGEVICVIGPSGSGKSTFLRCLNRLEEATAGEILVDGQSITEKSSNIDKIRQHIGMVFQQFNLFPHYTVKENIMLAPVELKLKSKEEAEKKALELLKRVGLAEKADASKTAFRWTACSVWQLHVLLRWNRISCCLMNRLQHWIQRWFVKFLML